MRRRLERVQHSARMLRARLRALPGRARGGGDDGRADAEGHALKKAIRASAFGIVDALVLGRTLTRETLLLRRSVSGPHLDLSGIPMNPLQVLVFARAGLTLNRCVHWLRLTDGSGRTRLGDLGGVQLARSVRVNKALTALTLRGARMGRKALAALCDGLRHNRALTFLDLSANGLGEVEMGLLASMLRRNKGLLQLKLSENHCGEEAADVLLAGLKHNKTLTHLDLGNCRLGDNGAMAVIDAARRSRTLACLNVSGRDMDPDGYVDNLSLFAAEVMGDALRTTRHIAVINVSGVWLPLFEAREGTTVDLAARGVQDLDVLALLPALERNKSLTHLDVSNNKISSSAVMVLLERVIQPRTALRFVNVANNYIDLQSADKMGELLYLASDSDIEAFRVADSFLLPVRQLTGVEGTTTLRVPGSDTLDPREQRIISRLLFLNTTTHTLNGLTMMDDVGEADFANREVEYYEVLFLMRQFQRHQYLTKLNLSGIGLDAHGAKAVADGVRQHALLQDLNLENNNLGPTGATAVIRALETVPKLHSLNMSWTAMQDVGAEATAELLRGNPRMQALELRGCDITHNGMQALGEVLQDEPDGQLRRLCLSHNHVRADSATVLAQALPTHASIQELDLEDNVIGLAGVRILMNALATPHRCGPHSGLRDLNIAVGMQDDFARLSVGEEGGRLVSYVIRDNHHLTALNLAEVVIGPKGVAAMADMLSSNFSLLRLGLLSCGAGVQGAVALATTLAKQRNLREINLRNNGLGDEGLEAIVNALRSNKALEVVNLSLNGGSEAAATHLHTSLPDFSEALRIVVFGENQVSDELRSTVETEAAERQLAVSFLNYKQPNLSGTLSKLTQD